MNIEQIGSDGVIISLCDKDMEKFDVTFESLDYSEEHSRNVLKELMQFASVKTGINFHNKKILIEAMKYDHGCLILFTVSEKNKKRKIYKIIGRSEEYTFIFENTESFLACIKMLYQIFGKNIKSSAYIMNNNYYIILHSVILDKNKLGLISEFSCDYQRGKLLPALLYEHGEKIAYKNAIEMIGCYL